MKKLLALISLIALTSSTALMSCQTVKPSNESSLSTPETTATTTPASSSSADSSVASTTSSSTKYEPAIDSIEVIAAKTTLNIGESLQLIVKITPEEATAESITFKSSNEDILYVTQEGLVTAVSEGEAKITCSVKSKVGQQFEKEITFSVKPVEVTGVKITNANKDLALNSKTQLTVEIAPNNATNKRLTYVSNNSKIISIDQTGLMTALAIGTAEITVRSDSGSFEDTVTFNVVSEYTKHLNEIVEELKASEGIESQRADTLKISGTYQQKGMITKYKEDTEVKFYSNYVNITTKNTQKIGDDSTKKTSKIYNGVDLDHSRYFSFKMSDASKGMTEDDLANITYKDADASTSLEDMKKDASLYYLDSSETYGLLNVIDYYAGKGLERFKLTEDLKKITDTSDGFEITYQGMSEESTPRYVDLSLKATINEDKSIKEIHFATKIYKKSDLDENNSPKADATPNEFRDYTYTMNYADKREEYTDTSFSPKMFYFTSLEIKTYHLSTDLDNHKYFTIGNTIEIEPINYSPASATEAVDTISVAKIENENDNGAVILTDDGTLKAAKLGKSTITFKTLSGLEVRKEVEVIDKDKVPNGLTEITIDGESKSYLTGNNNLKAGETHTILFKFNPKDGSQEFTLLCDDKDVVLNKIDGGFTISRATASTKTINVTICGPYDYTLRVRFTFTE